MPQDIFTLKRTTTELNLLLKEAKVNKISQPTNDEVVLTLYQKKVYNLVISTFAKYSRVSLTNLEKPNPLTAPNFCMLLRKYLSGATLKSFSLANNDRIVQIDFVNDNDFKELKQYSLFVEIMGKYSNVFFTQDNKILGVLKQHSVSLESKRVVFVGSTYSFPLKQDKFDAEIKEDLDKVFDDNIKDINGKFILNNFINFAPITAEEVAYRINKNSNNKCNKIIAKNTIINMLNEEPKPTKIDGYSDVFAVDYSHLLGERKTSQSLLDLQADFYDNLENNSILQTLKNALEQKITHEEKKELKKLSLLEERENQSKDADIYRIYGELITNNIYNIKKGANKAKVYNYYQDNEIEIPLSVELSPQENAKRYFKKYNKLKNAYSITLEQKEQTLSELNYLNSLKTSIELAESLLDLKETQEELIRQGYIKVQNKPNKKVKEKTNFLTYNIDDFTIKVGKNNLQNEELLSLAYKDDLWLHTKDYHSSFVIISSSGKAFSDKIIKIASEICAYYSQGRNGDKIEVVYTLRKNVKKMPNAKCGQVVYNSYNSIVVSPNKHI